MKSFSLATTAIATPTAMAASPALHQLTSRRDQPICLPHARYVKLIATTEHPIAVFEVLAMDANDEINFASTDFNSLASASQSSTLKDFEAGNAIDGDWTTFSHTNAQTGDFEYLKIDFGEEKYISEIQIENRWCKSPEDEKECLCRLSYANVWMYDDNDAWIAGEQLGDTCNQNELKVAFAPDTQYCEGVVGTPGDTLAAGVCQDDPDFISFEGGTCHDVESIPIKDEICERDGILANKDENGNVYKFKHYCQVACGVCDPTVIEGIDEVFLDPALVEVEPTYSPTYLPSAQPVAVGFTVEEEGCLDLPGFVSSAGRTCQEVGLSPIKEVLCSEGGILANTDLVGNVLPVSHYCKVSCGECNTPTYSPTYVPSSILVAVINEPVETEVDTAFEVEDPVSEPLIIGTTVEEEACLDILGFVSSTGKTCQDVESSPIKEVLCSEGGILANTDLQGNVLPVSYYCKVSCGECNTPTYSPTYVPSSILVAVINDPVETEVTDSAFEVEEPFEITEVGITEEGPDEFDPALTAQLTTPQPITAQPVVASVPAPSEPTYSPSYVPSAQPVATGATISSDTGTEIALHGYACEDNHETVTPTSCAELATRPDKDHMCYVYGMDVMCPVTCGMCVPNPETTTGAMSTAMDSTSEDSASSSADASLSGHAYSVGDKCEDDQSFVSNKGITCKSFVYAENVHCRSPSGMHDEGFNSLRYSDFCPKTCGMCAELVAAASNVKAEGEAYDKGIALGVGLSVSMLVVILLAWICCRGNYTGKSNNLDRSPPSEFHDDPASQFSDDAGGNEMTGDSNIARIAESVGETVAKTEIV